MAFLILNWNRVEAESLRRNDKEAAHYIRPKF